MPAERADVAVIGAGPAGSAAALVLARAGARVALVDKTVFPRDKACGDLVGPRGVQVLEDLGVHAAGAEPVGDMRVVGPTGRSVRLPCRPGRTYPVTVSRSPVSSSTRRSAPPLSTPAASRARPRRRSATRRRAVGGLRAVGRDQVARRRRDRRRRGDEPGGDCGRPGRRGPGAVGVRAALLPRRVRRPADDRVVGRDPLARLPRLRLGLPRARGAGQPRRRGRRARRPGRGRPCSPVVGSLRRCAPPIRAARSSRPPARRAARRLAQDGDGGNSPGAWLRLLVGDAAGLVNPLQGEGISEALASGRAAAEAVLACPGAPATLYRSFLAQRYATFHASMPPSRPRSCGEPPSSPRRAGSSRPCRRACRRRRLGRVLERAARRRYPGSGSEHSQAGHRDRTGSHQSQPNPALRHERPHQWHVNELRAGSALSAVGR